MKIRFLRRCAVWMVGVALLVPASALAGSPAAYVRLQKRLGAASVVVQGRVSRVVSHDHDRVRVIHLAVDRVLKGGDRIGPAAGTIEVVEMRDRPDMPPLLDTGEWVVAFLGRRSRNSYLDETLGGGRRWQVLGGVFGVLSDSDQTVVNEVAAMVGRLVDHSRSAGESEFDPALERRAWVFDAIAARHGGLVEDGAAGLSDVPGLSEDLGAAEEARLRGALHRTDLPPRVSARLFTGIGQAGLVALAPAMAGVTLESPEALSAAWEARAALGAVPPETDFLARLRDPNPEVRSAVVASYAAFHPESAVIALGRSFATESEPSVRIATLEALGPIPGEESTKTLEAAFVEDGELAVRQAAGRVLFARGGEAASESLSRLAFEAAPEGQRHAIALLIALDRSEDASTLERIRTTHPDEKAREMATHGFSDGHH